MYLPRHDEIYKVAFSRESYFLDIHTKNTVFARFEELFVQQLKLASEVDVSFYFVYIYEPLLIVDVDLFMSGFVPLHPQPQRQ